MPWLPLAAVVVVGLLPLVAVAGELLVAPEVLWGALTSSRVLGLWGATVLLSLAVALCSMIVGVPAGWLLARTTGRSTRVLAQVVVLPLVLPPWIAGLAWSRLLPLSGFVGATFLLTASLWPLVALFALRGFRGATRATEVAVLARGMGAARASVELPLALPSILSGALLVFVFALTDFGVVDFLSFTTPAPFTVLSSEIFQRWSRLDSGAGAAAVSVLTLIPALAALGAMLMLERRHLGRHRGPQPVAASGLASTGRTVLTGVLLSLFALVPLGVLLSWTFGPSEVGPALARARDPILVSVGVAVATGVVVALLGVTVARATLEVGGRRGSWLLAATLLPLAAPGVMFAVGEIRLWNHRLNPLADAVYPSTGLLVLALAGRYLALGVLAARALLARQDRAPLDAARLVARPAWQRWFAVDAVLLAPATALAFGLGYVLAIRELDMIVLLPAGSATLSHYIFSLVHLSRDDMTALLCVVLLLLVLVPATAARLLGVPGVDCGPRPHRP